MRIATALLCSVTACTMMLPTVAARADFVDKFAGPIEAAHGKAMYDKQQAVQADFEVNFGGGKLIAGTMTFDTPVGKTRLELDTGTTIVFDGSRCWVSPADAEIAGPPARFHALTWPYFAAAMHKLRDPGSQLADAGEQPLSAEQSLPAGKLTFGEGVGDAPDDWYLVFRDPQSNLLHALAYIVTYDKDATEAEKQPSIVFYDDYTEVDGVKLPTKLTFYFWDAQSGRQGDPKGTMTMSNIEFVTPEDATFRKPDEAREDALPGSQK